MQDYRNVKVWAKAHELTLAVYSITCVFPKEETYGLTSQLRRAAVSIPTNIAEGCGRSTSREFARFLDYSAGSTKEVDYLLQLSTDLKLISSETYTRLHRQTQEIERMLSSLQRRLRHD